MKIYIAEDEPLAAAKLKLFLEKAGEGGDISTFGDGSKLQTAIREEGLPDLIFLDIQMPNLTGLEFLKSLQNTKDNKDAGRTAIIITSAYDQYAIDGFNYGVTDYLLKPYTLDRLNQALSKVHHELERTQDAASADQMIGIRSEGRTEMIRVADIVCLEAFKDYTQLVLSDGRKLTTLGTLSSFEQQLPSARFARVQRSYIVGLKHVCSYNTQSVLLTSGEEVPMGKTYRESFETSINNLR